MPRSCLVKRHFPNFHGRRNSGRNVWAMLKRNPHIFWYSTGETPQTLEVIVNNIGYDVAAPRHVPRTPRSNRRRRCLLDTRNRVLLVVIWLTQYLKYHILAYICMTLARTQRVKRSTTSSLYSSCVTENTLLGMVLTSGGNSLAHLPVFQTRLE